MSQPTPKYKLFVTLARESTDTVESDLVLDERIVFIDDLHKATGIFTIVAGALQRAHVNRDPLKTKTRVAAKEAHD